MTPVILSRLGASTAAGVFVALAVARLAATFDLGIVGLAIPHAAELLSQPGSTRRFLMRSIARLAALSSFVGFVAVLAVAAGTRLPGFPDRAESAMLLGGAAAVSLSFQMMMLVTSVLYAAQRFWILAASSGLGASVYVVTVLAGLTEGRGWLVIAAVVSQNLAVFTAGWFALRGQLRLRPNGDRWPASDQSTSLVELRARRRMQFIGVGGVAAAQAPAIIAAFVLDPVAVASVGVAQQVATAVRLAGSSLAGFFLATLSRVASGEERFRHAHQLHRRWIWVCIAGGVATTAIAPPAVAVWLGDSAPPGTGWASAYAAAAGAGLVSTLVASSYQRTIGELLPEVIFVSALLAGVPAISVAAVVGEGAPSLWAAAAVVSLLCGGLFSAWFKAGRQGV